MHAYGSSSRAAAALCAVHWHTVVRVGALNVSPLSPASECSARRRLPSRGSLGPHFPTFAGTLRRYDCPLSISGALLVARLPDTLPAAMVRGLPAGLVARGTLQGTPGPLVSRSPFPALPQGDRWLSHVPAFPLWKPAPLSDPGGVLDTRPCAPRTAAFRRLQTVGFPLPTACGISHCPQLYPCRGSITRPAFSLHPASYGPLRGGTRVRY